MTPAARDPREEVVTVSDAWTGRSVDLAAMIDSAGLGDLAPETRADLVEVLLTPRPRRVAMRTPTMSPRDEPAPHAT